jgi:hypothetical protein
VTFPVILRIAVVGTRPPRDPAFISDFVARVGLAFEGSLPMDRGDRPIASWL